MRKQALYMHACASYVKSTFESLDMEALLSVLVARPITPWSVTRVQDRCEEPILVKSLTGIQYICKYLSCFTGSYDLENNKIIHFKT